MKTHILLHYMQRAIDLALKANPSPNPRVGAMLVKGNRIIAEGFHKQAGGAHAEIMALRKAGKRVHGATLYITMEPCCHVGRTPPCTAAIIAARVKKVVIGMSDPNPLVSGKGMQQLRDAGISVTVLPDTSPVTREIKNINKFWIKRITTGMPYITIKVAQSLDGKICTASGDSKWISSAESRKYVHNLRTQYDAILVGIGTVLADDPQLSARLGKNFTLRSKDRQPVRVVLDRELRIPINAKVIGKKCIVFAEHSLPEKEQQLEESGATVIIIPHLTLDAVLHELGKREINSVLIEGGSGVYTSALEEGVVDHVIFFIASKLIGGKEALTAYKGKGAKAVDDALKLKNVKVQQFGGDLVMEGELQ